MGTTASSRHDEESPYRIEWSSQAERLREAAGTDAAWYAALAPTLVRPTDRTLVDVGCGGGGMALAMAAVVPADARVIGIDGDVEVLAGARANTSGTGIELAQADLDEGTDALRGAIGRPADLIWAGASVHHAADQQAAVDALAALLAPDGRLVLGEGGLLARWLPWDLGVGRPGLEVRLWAAENRLFAEMRAGLSGSRPMPYGWTEALRRSGLSQVTTRTTLEEHPAPLPAALRVQLVDDFRSRTERLSGARLLDPGDEAVWRRLLDADDPAYVARRDDTYFLDARSIHVGCKGHGHREP